MTENGTLTQKIHRHEKWLCGADVLTGILVSAIGGPARGPVLVRTGASPASDRTVN